MFQTFKKLVRLNLDDLCLYMGVEGGLFLLIQIIIGCVMHFERPNSSVTVACVLFPIVGGFCGLIASVAHVGVSFDQAFRFSQTRRRALGLTLGLASFQTAFAMAFGGLLAVVERFLCVPLWVRLAGMNNWVLGLSGSITPAPPPGGYTGSVPGPMFYNMAEELVPLPEKTLIVETFTLDWYWWLLIFAVAIMGGTIIAAVIQRFGSKGGWILWGICIVPVFLGQVLPWRTHVITDWLFPLLGVVFVAGFLWSIWSLLHAVVRA